MRYLPLTGEDRRDMLAHVGVTNVDDLFAAVPAGKLLKDLPNLPKAKGELEVERELGRLAARNTPAAPCPSSSVPAPIATMYRRASIT